MGQVTAEEVMSCLASLDYPAMKEDVVAEAQREGAPEGVLRALRAMPLGEYASRDEVRRSVETVEESGQTPSEKGARSREQRPPGVAEHMRTTR